MFVVSMKIPKNERRVEGPLILDGFPGALICSQSETVIIRLLGHLSEAGDPAIKKLFK